MRPRTESGFTLIELISVICILAITTSLAVSGFRDLITYTESRAAIQALFSGFQLARSEAIKRQQSITICPLDSAGRCSTNWEKPISVFVDTNRERILESESDLFHTIYPPETGYYQVQPGNRRYFQFDMLGTSHGTIGNVTYCRSERDGAFPVKQLILNMAGRVTLARDKNNDGVIEKNSGAPITCT